MLIKIAITGNIASGKSQAENIISNKYGFTVYDADIIAHSILDNITDFYGYDVFTDGKIDRNKLGSLVFSNPDLKIKLEQLTHPKIKSEIIHLFEKHSAEKYIFVSVPLLFEAGFEDIFDKILLITTDENLQLTRLISRNNYSEKEAIIRIESQMPQVEKIKHADYVIENNGSMIDFANNIDKFIKQLINTY